MRRAKQGQYLLEAAGLWAILGLFALLPPKRAAQLGGSIGIALGGYLPASQIARRNLARVFPHLSAQQHKRIVRECWRNLGSTLAELPHLDVLIRSPAHTHVKGGIGWQIEGEEHLATAKAANRPIIFFSGHLGNWEFLPPLVAHYGLPFASFYRAPNNPLVDRILRHFRQKASAAGPLFPKGAHGARQALTHLARGKHVGILADQKMNDGIAVPLFGHPAMTSPATAALALRFGALIVPGRIQRLGPARLRLQVAPPIDSREFLRQQTLQPGPQSRQHAISALTEQLNKQLEEWISSQPEEWLWLHRRWEKAFYRQKRMKKSRKKAFF